MFTTTTQRRLAIAAVLSAAVLFVVFRAHIPLGVMFVVFPFLFFAALLTVVYLLAQLSKKIW
ncbi:hypothetical protein ACYJ1Y_02580 [Natrialbaceae archaeon A-gly3]